MTKEWDGIQIRVPGKGEGTGEQKDLNGKARPNRHVYKLSCCHSIVGIGCYMRGDFPQNRLIRPYAVGCSASRSQFIPLSEMHSTQIEPNLFIKGRRTPVSLFVASP
jgi:hypothetical protein